MKLTMTPVAFYVRDSIYIEEMDGRFVVIDRGTAKASSREGPTLRCVLNKNSQFQFANVNMRDEKFVTNMTFDTADAALEACEKIGL